MNNAVVYEKKVIFPTYEAGEMEKDPLFIEKRAYQGSTGKVYPVPICEKISEEKHDKEYKAVILENDYIYVMILPELGGRIQRALDKTNGYDFVYFNHVIKPALVGLTGPWISGGIEFNWPQHHRPSTFMPVDYTFSENPDGSATVILGETDRINGTKADAAITLYPDKAYIEIKGQLYNPTDYPQTFLWWANPAVSVNDSTFSVFPPDVNAVMDHGKRAVSTFPIATGEYYKADYSAGVDISRYKNIKVPTSYMAAHSDFDFVGNFDESRDAGLLHVADHHVSPGKKQWTWGCGNFGKMWDHNLTDDDGPYIELMTGVYCDNQPDFTWLKPGEEKNFVQYFMPYKAVGRVGNATKDVVIGVENLSEDGSPIQEDPFENEGKFSGKKCVKVYATGKYDNAEIVVTSGDHEIYREKTNLSPVAPWKKTVDGMRDYTVTVEDSGGTMLCRYKEYVKEKQPVPESAEPLKKPEEIGSLEELYLAGQHLEQYRHATFLPSDYYLEGLRRDPTDIRLNNAYGLYLLRNAQIDESIPYYKAAIKKQTWRNPNPYSGESYFNLGLALELKGDLEQAYDSFYKSTWSNETAGEGYLHLAEISVMQGETGKALEFAQESLNHGWHNMKARNIIAGILHHTEPETAEFREFVKESLDMDPLNFGMVYRGESCEQFMKKMGGRVENYINLGLELVFSGFYEDALGVLSLCSAESPMKHYIAAYALKKAGSAEKGKEESARAEALPPDFCFPNRVEEYVILSSAANEMNSPKAHYYLGNLLYDKKQYEKATSHWEQAAEGIPDMAVCHRNLSIAYFNHGNPALAENEIAEACRLEPDNSRFLLEQDQLLKRLGRPVKKRLEILEKHADIIPDRYALMLAYVSLLNADCQYSKALDLIMNYTFHVWEGGEGKVADEYKKALFGLAQAEMEKGSRENLLSAIEYAERTLTYPENLGEGKLENVPDNQAYYIMGCCWRKLGENVKAEECFRRAAAGSQIPEPVRYYNDQPSDYIYYQGLAFEALGEREKALKSFHQLIIFGQTHIFDKVGYDFFAVSMPELEVYADDIQARSDEYCRRMAELGRKGLEQLK